MSDEYIELEVEVVHVTAKAVLVKCEDLDEEKWIPLSCITWEGGDVEMEKGEKGTLHVAKWFAEREGMY